MTTKNYPCMGMDVKFPIADSVAEYDVLGKKANACLDSANDNETYRGTMPVFKNKFCSRLSEQTGVLRKTRTVTSPKTGKITTPFDETPNDYFVRVLAETNTKVEDYIDLKRKVESELTFNPAQREPAPEYGARAKRIIDALIAKGSAEVEKSRANMAAYLGMEVGSAPSDLYIACTEFIRRKTAEMETLLP